jgi:DNA mismatch endonuclease (patch repair protein)
MSRIGGKNTKPELLVRKLLHSLGYRFRLHRKDLPGKPDLVLPKFNIVLFVHGCFWHSHDCPKGTKRPQTNIDFWENKISNNIKRDATVNDALIESGWKVVVIWECQTKNPNSLKERLLGLLPPVRNTVQ